MLLVKSKNSERFSAEMKSQVYLRIFSEGSEHVEVAACFEIYIDNALFETVLFNSGVNTNSCQVLDQAISKSWDNAALSWKGLSWQA